MIRPNTLKVLRRFASDLRLPSTLDRILKALGALDDDLVTDLIEAVKLDERDVVVLALEILAEYGHKSAQAVPAIADRLNCDDRLVRAFAIAALESIGLVAYEALEGLMMVMGFDAEEYLRLRAAEASIAIAPCQLRSARAVLLDGLASYDPIHQSLAAEALGRLGHRAGAAEFRLRELVDGDTDFVRCAAARALWKITGASEEARRVGEELMADPDPWVREMAREYLKRVFGRDGQ